MVGVASKVHFRKHVAVVHADCWRFCRALYCKHAGTARKVVQPQPSVGDSGTAARPPTPESEPAGSARMEVTEGVAEPAAVSGSRIEQLGEAFPFLAGATGLPFDVLSSRVPDVDIAVRNVVVADPMFDCASTAIGIAYVSINSTNSNEVFYGTHVFLRLYLISWVCARNIIILMRHLHNDRLFPLETAHVSLERGIPLAPERQPS